MPAFPHILTRRPSNGVQGDVGDRCGTTSGSGQATHHVQADLAQIGKLISRPWAFLGERIGLRTDGNNVAIYWDEAGEGSIEVGVQVTKRFEGRNEVVCSATPAGTVARTCHFGPYDQLGAAHEAVRKWCRQNAHETVMPFWEVYGDWDDNPAKLRPDVFYRLE